MRDHRAALLNQQVVLTGGYDGKTTRDEVLCGILWLIVFYLAFVSRCFSTMLRQEIGHKSAAFKRGNLPMPSLKSTLHLWVALVISIQSNKKLNYCETRRSRSDSGDSLTDLLSVSTDLTDVTLVSDDTYWRLDWCYSSKGSDES